MFLFPDTPPPSRIGCAGAFGRASPRPSPLSLFFPVRLPPVSLPSFQLTGAPQCVRFERWIRLPESRFASFPALPRLRGSYTRTIDRFPFFFFPRPLRCLIPALALLSLKSHSVIFFRPGNGLKRVLALFPVILAHDVFGFSLPPTAEP